MPSWGLQEWGTGAWSISNLVSTAANSDAPVISLLQPLAGSNTVSISTTVSVAIVDANYDLDLSTITMTLNGDLIYTGTGGFVAGYTGSMVSLPQGTLLEFAPDEPWAYDFQATLYVTASDSLSNTASQYFSWQFESNPRCYTGLDPIPFELQLQEPLTRYLVGEQLRRVLVDAVLKDDNAYIANSGTKAARSIIQVAHSTELKTLLNRKLSVPDRVLTTVICERDRDLHVDQALASYIKDARALIDSMIQLGDLPQYYVATLNDYLNSNRYQYRVSAIACLIILAKVAET